MSKLGNLFGGSGPAENNDALKFNAPKEPRKKGSVVAMPAAVAGIFLLF